MFNNLTNKFQDVFRHLTGNATLTESNIAESMEKIRLALLEADVEYEVAGKFVEECRQACLGEAVLRNVKPGEQAVKVVYDRLTALLGEEAAPLKLEGDPAVIMLCGLHGSGKTTTAAKLAKFLRDKSRKKVLLAACDLARPAAIDQLSTLGQELRIRVFAERGTQDVPAVAEAAVRRAQEEGLDVVILDTAGRLQIDGDLIQELKDVKARVSPQEILLVGDAALGQQAVSVAKEFDQALGITGIILTKMDGDARGGAALSMHQVTGRPVKFLTVGERPNDLEIFHPDRMASRILGMGDILSLYEKAAEEIKEEEAKQLEERFRKNNFGFDDFLSQMQRLKNLGGMMKLLKLIPGMGNLPEGFEAIGEKEMKKVEVLIQSMTPSERRTPEIINRSRRMRIAKGSHHTEEEVQELMKRFQMMRGMVANMNRNGGLASMGNMFGGGAAMGGMPGMGGAMSNPFQPPRMGSQSVHAQKEQQKRLEKKKLAKQAKKKNRH